MPPKGKTSSRSHGARTATGVRIFNSSNSLSSHSSNPSQRTQFATQSASHSHQSRPSQFPLTTNPAPITSPSPSTHPPSREDPEPRRELTPPGTNPPRRTNPHQLPPHQPQRTNPHQLPPHLPPPHQPPPLQPEQLPPDQPQQNPNHEEEDNGEEGNQEQQNPNVDYYQELLDGLLRLPGREHLPLLSEHPIPGVETLWFNRQKGQLSRAIYGILRRKFDGPYYSWKVTPVNIQERYFMIFARKYNWNIGITELVKAGFLKIAKKRMKGIVSQARRSGVQPPWIETLIVEVLECTNT
ncbi:PREDICTED: probable serine/threonine-protein kinase DDB_G0281745 [Camelina sativa]|uniref:Probable serine/threonine-protein kinase DDB_G0281745 n=1 Tax=Camelina sativa TaxID=90675 RepID=A0ABM1QQP9_CAMSA|nr:PREDICTED: probable serine/threonine-protein kinase DDB_G0281745 [Camelina sativa]